MPVIFKIFVFLLLQQGTKIAKDVSRGESGNFVNLETVWLARPMSFSVQGDDASVNQIISVFTAQDMSCEVKSESGFDGMAKAEMTFRNLAFADKAKMMNRVQHLLGRAQFEWKEL